MKGQWRECFIAWAQAEEYRQRVQQAHACIAHALTLYEKPLVAFSGGKDSIVMLHLTLQHNPNLMVIHWDYGDQFMPRRLEKKIIGIARDLGAKNLRVYHQRLSAHGGQDFWRGWWGFLTALHEQHGFDACFVGLRAEESSRRKRRIKHKRFIIMPEVWPLAEWTWLDVWAYIISHSLPYLNEYYDAYAEVMGGYEHVRLSTLFDRGIGLSYKVDEFMLHKDMYFEREEEEHAEEG